MKCKSLFNADCIIVKRLLSVQQNNMKRKLRFIEIKYYMIGLYTFETANINLVITLIGM